MKSLAIAGMAAALSFAPAAEAAPLLFKITGDYTASFQLDSEPTPDFVDADTSLLFAIQGVPGFADSSNGLADLSFFAGQFAGLLISDNGDGFTWLLDASGPQLFSGTLGKPVFQTGVFQLDGLSTPGNFTLTISAVPEPATWAMMVIGFGLAGTAMRRARKTVKLRYKTA